MESPEVIAKRVRIARRKIKDAGLWGRGYLEELCRNAAQLDVNALTNIKNKGKQDRAMVKFLAVRGYSANQIASTVKDVALTIKRHYQSTGKKKKK